ncbi:type II toxin-antitoxin system CcdA family antitoxin [Pannonibacter phragmitetus]|uniref:type II toxin-antitoxin system CcdA family antitoxin n=1 Tax=Pannonibacter phragmitetus TaxID=121719 RepID=UPI000F44DA07|nr:type II toxin-antitoxin system CcdA family antitoxin [Pannonibacter phragmitetus]MBA4207280.1 post-segregation antitoxin CcdA [Polymorphum sp.]
MAVDTTESRSRRVARGPARGKRAVNLSLDPALLEEARAMDLNLSQAAEEGLRQAVSRMRAEIWLRENAAALESSNAWVEENGLPLDQYRQF